MCYLWCCRHNPNQTGREDVSFEEIPFVKEEWAKKLVLIKCKCRHTMNAFVQCYALTRGKGMNPIVTVSGSVYMYFPLVN